MDGSFTAELQELITEGQGIAEIQIKLSSVKSTSTRSFGGSNAIAYKVKDWGIKCVKCLKKNKIDTLEFEHMINPNNELSSYQERASAGVALLKGILENS